jgi:hypothetical protein
MTASEDPVIACFAQLPDFAAKVEFLLLLIPRSVLGGRNLHLKTAGSSPLVRRCRLACIDTNF